MTENPPPDDRVLRLGMDRRRFMLRAAALGLTAAAFPAFLAACAQLDAEDALPLSDASGHAFSHAHSLHFRRRKSCAGGNGHTPAVSNLARCNGRTRGPTSTTTPTRTPVANHPGCHPHSRLNANRTVRYRNTRRDRPHRYRYACRHAGANPPTCNTHTHIPATLTPTPTNAFPGV